MPVIYLDVLLALNLFIDFLLLSATVRILRLPSKRWRLVIGAGFGALSCCLLFLPEMPGILSTVLKLLAAAILIRIALRWQGALAYIKALTVFFVLSTVFGGVAFMLWYFVAPQGFYVVNGVVYYDVPPLLLVALTVLSYMMIWLYDRFTRKPNAMHREYRLLADCGAGTVALRALYDSGNTLTEVFSGNPVVVVRYDHLQQHVPPALRQALEAHWAPAGCPSSGASAATATAVRAHLRLVPFRSVGGEGLLPAFQPAHLTLLLPDGQPYDISGAYLAVTKELGHSAYDALIGAELAALHTGTPDRPNAGFAHKRGPTRKDGTSS